MTTPNQMATALLTEHFRFTPLTLIDEIVNTVNEIVHRAVDAIEEGLGSTSPAALGFTLSAEQQPSLPDHNESGGAALQTLQAAEISTGAMQLESLLNATVDRDFDKFELYTLRNILAVGREEEDLARWVRLEHYRDVDLANTTTQSDPALTPALVRLARRKLHETAKLHGMLRAEEARNAAVLAQLRALLGRGPGGAGAAGAGAAVAAANGGASAAAAAAPPLAFLTASRPTSAAELRLALAYLPTLRALLASLKGSLHALPAADRANGRRGDGEGEMGAKRRRYLEGRTRRALERRGVVMEEGSAAAVGGGRRVGRDEVEGLEAVVESLGRGGQGMDVED